MKILSQLPSYLEKICCYKCKIQSELCIEEKRCNQTGKIIEKNFICIKCAGIIGG
jgi:hypothetical protein